MAYSLEHYRGLQEDVEALGYRRIVAKEDPPIVPTYDRTALFALHMNYGATGAGKTVALCYWGLEKYHIKAPEFGVDGFKVFWIDVLGKGEMASAFAPMPPSHPLFPLCQQIGLSPESYRVEVLRPLIFVRGQPELLYEQPDIVKPFTLALSDISLLEWNCILPSGLSSGQANLISKALKELRDVESASIYDLYVKCEEIISSGEVGYGSHIEQMRDTPTIPLSKSVFSGREAKGLLQKLEVVADTALVQPKFWRGKTVETNIDLERVLKDQKTISVLLIPRYKDLPHLNMGIVNYVLNHIYQLKHPNNSNRIIQPLCIGIPELRTLVPRHIPDRARYYVEPVKNTMLELNSAGTGIGICLIGDTQYFHQIDGEYRANVTSLMIFDLGEEASEKIKEIVRGRYVNNFKEITDDFHLSALKETGTFIYLGHGSGAAEIRRNALVGFFYPRSRGREGESETNFYDLFHRLHPERMRNVGYLYGLLLQINKDCQTRASERMHMVLAEVEKRKPKRKSKEEQKVETDAELLHALEEACQAKTYFEYKELTDILASKLGKSDVQARRYLKQLHKDGFLIVDKSQGRKQMKVIVDKSKVDKLLKEQN